MAITVDVLPLGPNNHYTNFDAANAFQTDFVTDGIVGGVTNTSGTAPMTGGFGLSAQNSPTMQLTVAAGAAYVLGTGNSVEQQRFRVKNSAAFNITIGANATGSTRYDFVYLILDGTKLATPNSSASDVASVFVSRSTNATTNSNSAPANSILLAVVTVPNNATTISNGAVLDKRSQSTLGAYKVQTFLGTDPAGTFGSGGSETVLSTITIPAQSIPYRVKLYSFSSVGFAQGAAPTINADVRFRESSSTGRAVSAVRTTRNANTNVAEVNEVSMTALDSVVIPAGSARTYVYTGGSDGYATLIGGFSGQFWAEIIPA